MRIYITSIPIADYNQALTFYTQILGFQKRRDIELGGGALSYCGFSRRS
ncbi:hypothetical protein KSX_57380 [Ktedonospora formicarum]|uniref:Glyoxalase/fosfomycin resistance/dioxygenase domain-containing protein n=1 Tax=Ktedonospora formicarum TaxID=2778364 RepID=A0A8J3MTW2_9CHLR|nr:hypothetical protein KSX_57380 [Ktedonospora formicarum]